MGGGTKTGDAGKAQPGFRDVLRIRWFVVPYAAETVSIAGDQLARVALSVLVFDRTGSAWVTALTYALTYVPAILGGVVLGSIGDRLPRRTVMIGCDVVRALLFTAMAIGGLPVVVLMVLLSAAVFLGPAFSAAMISFIAVHLDEEHFRIGTGLRMVTSQITQVGGFAVGGVVVALLHPGGALLVDAASFIASAAVIWICLSGRSLVAARAHRPRDEMRVRARPLPGPTVSPAARRPRPGPRPTHVVAAPIPVTVAPSPDTDTAGFRGLWREPAVRHLVLLSSLAGFFVVPEGLAVPFSHQVGASTTSTGLLLAALPLGGAVGAILLVTRVRRAERLRHAHWMAVGCGLPLIATALAPPWPVACLVWALSGVLSAYQVEVATAVVVLVPDAVRSRVIARAGAWLLGAQGAGLIAFGAVGDRLTPAAGIAIAGGVGSVAALVLVLVARPQRLDRQVRAGVWPVTVEHQRVEGSMVGPAR